MAEKQKQVLVSLWLRYRNIYEIRGWLRSRYGAINSMRHITTMSARVAVVRELESLFMAAKRLEPSLPYLAFIQFCMDLGQSTVSAICEDGVIPVKWQKSLRIHPREASSVK